MHRFVDEKHKSTFEMFYKELTGTALSMSISDHLPAKRKAPLVGDQSEPSSKQMKRSLVNEGGGHLMVKDDHSSELSTKSLDSSRHLNTSGHLNQGDLQ